MQSVGPEPDDDDDEKTLSRVPQRDPSSDRISAQSATSELEAAVRGLIANWRAMYAGAFAEGPVPGDEAGHVGRWTAVELCADDLERALFTAVGQPESADASDPHVGSTGNPATARQDVFSRPECIFEYCPNPDTCGGVCAHPQTRPA